MLDFLRRILVVLLMGLCIGLLFVSAKVAKAETREQWSWPVQGTITDVFGSRNHKHHGIDIAAPIGTPVYAVSEGRVTRSYYSDTYGHVVFISQTNGYESVYAHLKKRLVAEGDIVHSDSQIGEVGNTGRSSGAHLHFEVHRGKWNVEKTDAVNPLPLLDQEKLHTYVSEEMTAEVFKGLSTNNPFIEISVKKYDTLWSLATKHKTSVEKIKKWNGLKDDTLHIGQLLKVYTNN